METSYLEEISHSILDLNEKVSIKSVSNNWDLKTVESLQLLEKWLELNKSKYENKLNTEFVVRGISKSGHPVISIVSSAKVKNLDKVLAKYEKSLYAIELLSNSRSLNISQNTEIKCSNLPLESISRNISHAQQIVVSDPVPEPVKKPSAAASIPIKTEETESSSAKTNQKPGASNISSLFASQQKKIDQSKEENSVKEEKKSPGKPVVNSTAKESPKKKGAANNKVVNGKGSISSFFNMKPTPKTVEKVVKSEEPETKKEEKNEIVAKKITPVKKNGATSSAEKSVQKSGRGQKNTKRAMSDSEEEIPNTPSEKTISQIKKKAKPANKKTSAKKRLRIIAPDDSSDEDVPMREEPEEKFIKFDNADDNEEDDSVKKETKNKSLAKTITSPETKVVVGTKRKAKRMVTQTKEDEDGYMTTVQVIEEYTASESEDVPTEVEVKVKIAPVKLEAPVPQKKAKVKIDKTKQGSIMNFFVKK